MMDNHVGTYRAFYSWNPGTRKLVRVPTIDDDPHSYPAGANVRVRLHVDEAPGGWWFVSDVQVTALDGVVITGTLMHRIPLRRLEQEAFVHPEPWPFLAPEPEPWEAPEPGAEFAREWLATGAFRDGLPRREYLSRKHGITPAAVDKRVRAARDRGLLPPADTGRRRKG